MMKQKDQIKKSYDSLFYVIAKPNEYLVNIGNKKLIVELGAKRFKLFKKFIKVPGAAVTTKFEFECSSSNYHGITVKGFITWRVSHENPETAMKRLDLFDENDPLNEARNLVINMAEEVVGRSIAEIRVEEILKSGETLKKSLEERLEEVGKWGLVVDTIGIKNPFIKSERTYQNMQAEDRNKLRLIAEISEQQTESKIEQEAVEKKKEMVQRENELREIEIRGKMKEDEIRQEAEIESERLKKEKELQEIKLSENIEKDRYEYQKKRLANDAELQDIRLAMDEKNIELAEKKRLAEEGMTDREIAEMTLEKISEFSSIYRGSNITMIGDKAETLGAFVTPIQAISNMVKDLMKKSKETFSDE